MKLQIRCAIVVAVLLLSACGGSSNSGGSASSLAVTQNSSTNLGVIRISVTGLGTPNPSATAVNLNDPASGNSKSSSLSTDPCFLQLNPTAVDAGTFSVVTSAPGVTPVVYETYSSFTFQVRNAQGASGTVSGVSCTNDQANSSTLSNITLLGLVDPTATIDGTPFVSLTEFNGTKEPASTALSMLPTHGMVYNPETDTAQVQVGSESLQVFTEAQVDSLTVDTNNGAGSYLLPYGFVVRNVNPALGRTLQANPAAGEYDGQFTFAVKQSNNGNKSTAVYAFVYDLQAVTDSDTRVTQSVEEDNALGDVAANIRAATLGSTDLAVLNDGHVTASNIGDPICTVRTAGTHASPTAYLVPGSGSANTEPTVGSAPYNLQYLATTSAVNVGFCSPMASNGAGAPSSNTFAVYGSQSGLHTGTYTPNTAGNVVSFAPTKPFLVGETVSYSLTTALANSLGSSTLASAFVGNFTAGGTVVSTGSLQSLYQVQSVGSSPQAVAVGDFNGDGKPDLAVVNEIDGTVYILLNNGLGGYTTSTVSVGTNPYAVAVGDFNGDGKPDLAVVNEIDGTVSILLNNGSGGFPETASGSAAGDVETVNVGAKPTSVAVGDFNGDGHPDLAVANEGSSNVSILYNNGSGVFSATATNNATPGDTQTVSVGTNPFSVAVGDFNGDGKPDLAVANADIPGTVSILYNNGSGGFSTTVTNNATPGDTQTVNVGDSPVSVAVGDFNGDGKPDLAVVNSSDSTVNILYNSGSGVFSAITTLTAAPGDTETVSVGSDPFSVAVGDFNGDGHPDLAVANEGSSNVSILYNNGSGVFSATATNNATPGDTQTVSVGSVPTSVAVGDFNGDGKPDLVVTNYNISAVSILLNNGTGNLGGSVTNVGNNPHSVAAGDFNGDGYPDLAVGNFGDSTVSILLNNGLGGYTSSQTVNVGAEPYAIAVGDFNGDGHPDVVTANQDGENVSILLNNGSGGFTSTAGTSPGDADTVGAGTYPITVAVGDFNGDGLPDLVVGNNSPGNTITVLLNNGSGGYTSSTVSVGNVPIAVAVGDFNGDGHPDVAVVNGNDGTVSILLNNGSGGFTSTAGTTAGTTQTVHVGTSPSSIAVGDFNGDGHPDLAVANGGSQNVSILLNNGSGVFSATAGTIAGTTQTVSTGTSSLPSFVVVGDFNGDGYPDLAVGNDTTTGIVSILLNNGSGIFSTATAGTAAGDVETVYVGSGIQSLAVGDFTGSHKLGLALITGNLVQVLQQH